MLWVPSQQLSFQFCAGNDLGGSFPLKLDGKSMISINQMKYGLVRKRDTFTFHTSPLHLRSNLKPREVSGVSGCFEVWFALVIS